jgi:hypothetical protein
MNPFLENLLSALEKTPPNLGDADSVLTLLYDAYTELNNLDNAQIKADFHNLYQAMNGKDLREMDHILDPVCALCRHHEQSGFVEGVKVGIQLYEQIMK